MAPGRVIGGLIAVASTAVVMACASPSHGSTSDGSTSAAAPPATTAPATTRPAPAGCTLTVTAGGSDSASGHRSLILVFTNSATTTCSLRGYPEVAALDAASQPVAAAQQTRSGYMGGLSGSAALPTVSLAPGAAASALVEALAFKGSDGGSCTAWSGLRVTPPADTHAVDVAWSSDACDALQVHPVVPGTTGRAV